MDRMPPSPGRSPKTAPRRVPTRRQKIPVGSSILAAAIAMLSKITDIFLRTVGCFSMAKISPRWDDPDEYVPRPGSQGTDNTSRASESTVAGLLLLLSHQGFDALVYLVHVSHALPKGFGSLGKGIVARILSPGCELLVVDDLGQGGPENGQPVRGCSREEPP